MAPKVQKAAKGECSLPVFAVIDTPQKFADYLFNFILPFSEYRQGEGGRPKSQKGRLERQAHQYKEEGAHFCPLPPAQDLEKGEKTEVPAQVGSASAQARPLCHHQAPIDDRVGHEED